MTDIFAWEQNEEHRMRFADLVLAANRRGQGWKKVDDKGAAFGIWRGYNVAGEELYKSSGPPSDEQCIGEDLVLLVSPTGHTFKLVDLDKDTSAAP